MKREHAVLVGLVGVGALRQQELHHQLVLILAGLVEGRRAVAGLRVDVSAWQRRGRPVSDQGVTVLDGMTLLGCANLRGTLGP